MPLGAPFVPTAVIVDCANDEHVAASLRAAAKAFEDTGQPSPLSPSGPGGRTFLLVNHVMHRRANETLSDFVAKVTGSAVIVGVAKAVASDVASSLVIGNAPLQGCDHDLLLTQVGLQEAIDLAPELSQAEIVDLRGRRSLWTRFGAKVADSIGDPSDWVEVDLGVDSLLEPLYSDPTLQPRFRVGDYPAAESDRYHAKGRHVYVVARRVLECDTIVSVPKLKTHQKVGITCAIKGTVGAISRKECLAHHRLGSSATNGDEMSSNSLLTRLASRLNERAGGLGTSRQDNVVRVASKVMYRFARMSGTHVGGAWHGNDTAWRMAVDIARVLRFARVDGSLADTPQRQHFAVVDGIVAGEGNGPLRPSARRANLLIVANDPLAADIASAQAMGWDPRSLPIIANALDAERFPIAPVASLDDVRILDRRVAKSTSNGHFLPPPGWLGNVGFSPGR